MSKKLVRAKAKTTIDVPLSEKDLRDTADAAAKLMRELDTKDEEFKLLKREWNADLKGLRLRMREFLENYANRSRRQEVEATQVWDLATKTTWYEHNGAKHGLKELTAYEVAQVEQGNLFGDGPALPGVIQPGDSDPLPGITGPKLAAAGAS